MPRSFTVQGQIVEDGKALVAGDDEVDFDAGAQRHALEDARASGARHALDAEQVLDRHGRQRPGVGWRLLGDPEVGPQVVAGGSPAPVEGYLRLDERLFTTTPMNFAAIYTGRGVRALSTGITVERLTLHIVPRR